MQFLNELHAAYWAPAVLCLAWLAIANAWNWWTGDY